MTLKGDAIFRQKLTGDLKNDIKNLITFHASNCKSKNLHFDGFALSKLYKDVTFHKTEERSKEKLMLGTYALFV